MSFPRKRESRLGHECGGCLWIPAFAGMTSKSQPLVRFHGIRSWSCGNLSERLTKRGQEREAGDDGPARAVARGAIDSDCRSRQFRRPFAGAGIGQRGRISPPPRLGRSVVDIGDGRLVDAFRRHAGGEFPQRDRLSRSADAVVVPHLRDRGGRGRLCRACPGTAGAAHRRGRDRDGARHQPDALCRDVGGASGGTDVSGDALCRRLGDRVDRGERASRSGRWTADRPRPALRSARWRSVWRSRACITPPWRACGSTRNVSTSPASSARIPRCRAILWRC